MKTTKYIYHSDCGKGSISEGIFKGVYFKGYCGYCGKKFKIKKTNY